jgi:hypothetical protein
VVDALGRRVALALVPADGPLYLALPPALRPGWYVVRCDGQAAPLVIE